MRYYHFEKYLIYEGLEERLERLAHDFENRTRRDPARSIPFVLRGKAVPLGSVNPTKDRPENVETLIYMRFRDRLHSHRTPRTIAAHIRN